MSNKIGKKASAGDLAGKDSTSDPTPRRVLSRFQCAWQVTAPPISITNVQGTNVRTSRNATEVFRNFYQITLFFLNRAQNIMVFMSGDYGFLCWIYGLSGGTSKFLFYYTLTITLVCMKGC